ncbi:ribonuclease HII [Aureimonas leprariae]|uniref:Ribonuclease HII n=1 Tax=Plantimonas leprariae TaxID=2615207 RepID=A0A7V7TWQ6_9HYPH|nr:ribonuclease HII [Aureimonas leprariae]KAB0680263.1 ribonuclease HII [Aureimonas leprariae]
MPRRRPDSSTPSRIRHILPDFAIERERLLSGAASVAGIDEAGRGPLAGPVVAAAVILDPDAIPIGLDDSKKLSAAARERLFAEILAHTTVAIGSSSAEEIDRLNIRQATLLAMHRAAVGLAADACHFLVDGNDVPPLLAQRASFVIGGDSRSLSIAAASIVAKVMRDRMMARLGEAFPHYGFERHAGYGTPDHLAALRRYGPCSHHRRSFAPVRNAKAAGSEPAASN